MIEIVEDFLNKYGLLTPQKTYLVGFSGGYDSMCLLDILNKLSKQYSFNIVAVHFNHNWRGEEALLEAQNCEEFCNSNEITFYTETASVDNKHTETVARELRYDFFERCVKKFNADAVFTAHNKSDNAETLLYRIVKGTGIKGLESIQEHREFYYRPILKVSRAEIEMYCTQNNLSPNFDSSNNDEKYTRNFIRKSIMPKLKEINDDVETAMENLSQLAIEENKILNEYMELIKNDIFEDGVIVTKKFKKLSREVRKYLVYETLVTYGVDYDKAKVEKLLEEIDEFTLSDSGKKISLTSNLWFFISSKEIRVLSEKEKLQTTLKIDKEGEYPISNYVFSIKRFDGKIEKYPKDEEKKAYVEINSLEDIELRTRRDGDIISPLGVKGSMKLKKYLIDKKVPEYKRDEILLLCKHNQVLWVSGYGLSNDLKVVNQATHVIELKK